MRLLVAAPLAVAVVLLGTVQFLASVALRGSAMPGSWVRLVPAPLALHVEEVGTSWPLPPALRLVLARDALERGNLPLATADAAVLPPSSDRFALEAALAERRGEFAIALQDEFAAGDLAALERHVAAERDRGDIAGALALQEATIARFARDPTQADALAQAYFQLGRLQETQAYAFALGDPKRRAHERLARDAYAQATELAPFDERYLISYASQLVNLSDFEAAGAVFARARDADPTDADSYAGMGDIAFRRGNRAAARRYLARAQALDADAASVVRLARELGT